MHSTISERSDCLREEDIVTRMSADNGHHVIFGPGSSLKHNGFFHRHKEVVEMVVEPSYEVEEFMKLLSLFQEVVLGRMPAPLRTELSPGTFVETHISFKKGMVEGK
ncbi:hypothetical protein CDAR_411401 [Caerostris darwini]|uniref:Uncharacterized protein n=1 Tax=Caerostris darwini TaxID=1538125 RepID=A0AAV4SGZ7_9ARAC|nr:hypothetical protein CDAR_411401 [Caerostris darwini]